MSRDVPFYARDPDAWEAHLAEGNAKQPRKRVSADVILTDRKDRILLVDPRYKPDWDLPGGMAETNEPPHLTVARELKEELGLDIDAGPLLCVDWISPHGPWDDLLAFIFDGGQLSPNQVEQLSVRDDELAAFEFFTEAEAGQRLRDYVWRRTEEALRARRTGRVHYFVNGYRT